MQLLYVLCISFFGIATTNAMEEQTSSSSPSSSSTEDSTEVAYQQKIARRLSMSRMASFKRTSRVSFADVPVDLNDNEIIATPSIARRSGQLAAFAEALHSYATLNDYEKRDNCRNAIFALLKNMSDQDKKSAFLLAKVREKFLNFHLNYWHAAWAEYKSAADRELSSLTMSVALPLIPVDECTKFDPYFINHALNNWVEEKPYANPGKWDEDAMKKEFHVRKRYIYTPDNGAAGEMVFIVIHGTQLLADRYWNNDSGPMNPEYYDPRDKENPKFRNFMKFAAWYANKHNKKVELISFRWPGDNDDTCRRVAAKFLKDYMTQYYFGKQTGVLAHSHGCNVANILTQMGESPIDLLIYFACPVRQSGETQDSYNYTPEKFKKLIFFFSTGDLVASLGSVPSKAFFADVKSNVKYFAGVLLSTMVDSPIKVSLNVAKSIVNILNPTSKKLIGKALVLKVLEKNVIGIRVQHEAKDPGHSQVPYVASILPEILMELDKQYKHSCNLNSLFDLNYAGEDLEAHKKSLCVAIRKRPVSFLNKEKKDINQEPEETMQSVDAQLLEVEREEATASDETIKADLMIYKLNLLKRKTIMLENMADEMVKKILCREEAYSDGQKEKFRQAYSEEIDKNAQDSLDGWKLFKSYIPGITL